jgi:hypothetical protein
MHLLVAAKAATKGLPGFDWFRKNNYCGKSGFKRLGLSIHRDHICDHVLEAHRRDFFTAVWTNMSSNNFGNNA